MPDDVADHDDRGAVGLQEGVVSVAADLCGLDGRDVAHDHLCVVGLRRRGGLEDGAEVPVEADDPGSVSGQPQADALGLRSRPSAAIASSTAAA